MAEPSLLAHAHFWVGCLSVGSGFCAFAAPKGSRLHRLSGRVFVLTMAVLVATGLWLSWARGVLFTVFLSLLALHAFVTGWAVAVRDGGIARLITHASPCLSALTALGAAAGGVAAAMTAEGLLNDLPPGAFYLIAGISGAIGLLDVFYVLRRRSSEARRLARHLWRMGFAFFLAAGIFFFGNNHVLPAALRQPFLLSIPVLAVVLWTIFYLLRVWMSELAFSTRHPLQNERAASPSIRRKA